MPLSNVCSDAADLASQYSLRHRFFLSFAFISISAVIPLSRTTAVMAEVVSDQTLSGLNNTNVEPLDVMHLEDGYKIRGGSIGGANSELLFHSFERFSLTDEQTAEFELGPNTRSIFSRVTGGEPSAINGTIRASGIDFFFINPAGVSFGPEALVDTGGSAVFSTAESLIFSDNSAFDSVNPQTAPLLTVSQPIGLSLGETSQGISIDGAALEFDTGQTVLFASNGITFTAGGIIAPSGQVELMSLAPGSRINVLPADDALISRLEIENERTEVGESGYELGEKLRDIQLLAGGFVDTTSAEDNSASGRILLRGRQIDLEAAEVLSSNFGDLAGGSLSILAAGGLRVDEASFVSTSILSAGDGGDIHIEVGGVFDLLGMSQLLSQSGAEATGTAGTITISAGQLNIREGAEVSTAAIGDGMSGKLIINVPEGTVEISGISSANPSRLISRTSGKQAAGEIQIFARNLLVRLGGEIDAGTRGSGDSQGIEIIVAESVVVEGELGEAASTITSSSSGDSAGDAGAIALSTGRLRVADGGRVFTSTNGAGRGGDLIVDAGTVTLSGSRADNGLSGLFARTESSGDSGRLELTTGSLIVRDGARLTVSTDGDAPIENLGTVRDAVITADRVILDNGRIAAESRSGNGGILNFNVRDFLLLRNNSQISATAGTAAAGGDGGNVNILSPTGFIVAAPGEDSDIIANAFSGTGGNITVTTQSILGLEARRTIEGNGTNDIGASSEFGTDGTIVFNNLELDPTEGIVELPADTVSLGQIAERCLADSAGQNAFVVTGQGGMALSPRDVIRSEAVIVDVVADSIGAGRDFRDSSTNTVVEANGWRRDQEGTVVFVAPDPLAVATNSAHYHACLDQAIAQKER